MRLLAKGAGHWLRRAPCSGTVWTQRDPPEGRSTDPSPSPSRCAARARQVGCGVEHGSGVRRAAAVDEISVGANDPAIFEVDVEMGGDAGAVAGDVPVPHGFAQTVEELRAMVLA